MPILSGQWKVGVDMLMFINIIIGLTTSLITGSDQPAIAVLAIVGAAWALATGASYWLRLFGQSEDE